MYYNVHVRMKPVQLIEASNRDDAIEIVRSKFLNAFITKVEKTKKKSIWMDRIVTVTPKNRSYRPFTVSIYSRNDEMALEEAAEKGGSHHLYSIEEPLEELTNAI